MNRLPPSYECRVCGVSLKLDEPDEATDEERATERRLIWNGMCDPCQRDRQAAALAYMSAAETVRVVTQMFADAGQTPPSGQQSVLTPMRDRMRSAEARCVELKMWPADRLPSPGRFRGNR
jgi:hypothetical protein